MSLRLRNTMGGAVEPFQPIDPDHVRVYSCGPTVYAPSHVGNFRSFVFADLLVRYLRWSGYGVRWVMNITDVDDKIIRDARARDIPIGELTAPFLSQFREDLARLRIGPPDAMPRATDHIPQMAALVAGLMERGHAYRVEDGSIFFRIDSWPAYGRLAHLDPAAQRVGERVEADEYGKDDVRDFALWKGPREGEPSWETQVGPGRPGWHIECSAMAMDELGPSLDIHTGGIDLVFPHHEDEMAQSEAVTGQPFVRTWLHCAHLRMAGRKMAKREGNIARPAELYEGGLRPRALRYALLAAHYRAGLDFSEASLAAASAAVERLSTLLSTLDAYTEEAPDAPEVTIALEAGRAAFREAMNDDLDTPRALAAVFDLVRHLNRLLAARRLSTADAARAASAVRDLDRVLAVAEEIDEPEALPDELRGILEARAAARQARDWAESDRLREALAERGLAVDDTPDGQRWHRLRELVDG